MKKVDLSSMSIDEKVQAIKTLYSNGKIGSGKYTKVEYQRPVKTIKGCDKTIEKFTATLVRLGINYYHTQASENAMTTRPTTDQHLTDCPMLMTNTKGEYKLQMFTTHSDTIKPQVKYYVNGVETVKDEIVDMLKESSSSSINQGGVFQVKVENLKAIYIGA